MTNSDGVGAANSAAPWLAGHRLHGSLYSIWGETSELVGATANTSSVIPGEKHVHPPEPRQVDSW